MKLDPAVFYQDTSANKDRIIPIILYSEQNIETYSDYEKNLFSLYQFNGKPGELCLITGKDGSLEKVFVGADKDDKWILGSIVSKLPAGNYACAQLSLDAYLTWSTAQYKYTTYKSNNIEPRILHIDTSIYEPVLKLAKAIYLVRDLINAPANDLGPQELIGQLATLSERYHATYKEWVGEELLSENYPAIYTVGQASAKQPCLGYLAYGDPNHPHVTLIGKGVTFDSGGLDIKTAGNMRLMKKDMGGAAHVIGLAEWIMATKLPVYLQVFVPAVENAIGGRAYRCGDIITMRNGLTVEIENTDAEGRLILADVLAHASEDKPELIIDFATLTGAARIAVGTEISAMFSNNELVANNLLEAAIKRNDPICRLPLYSGYSSMFDSSVADLMNASSSPYAGAITAALFLQRFVDPSIAWVHFDLMAWNLSSKPGKPEGGEAMALLAVTEYLEKHYRRL